MTEYPQMLLVGSPKMARSSDIVWFRRRHLPSTLHWLSRGAGGW